MRGLGWPRGCAPQEFFSEHALRNLTGPGGTGITRLRCRSGWKKKEIAGKLRARLMFMHRRLEIVLFDVAVFYTLRELLRGTIYYVGAQRLGLLL